MKIKRHFFFTFAKRVVSRTYGGESYTLNVFENKGRGNFKLLGEREGCTRAHRGFESEAWQVVFPKLTPQTRKSILARVDDGASYYSYRFVELFGIKLEAM